MIRRVARGARDERGAVAIIVALVSVVLFGAAALAVDIANLTMERQELHDAVDAAAQAAAYDLPSTAAATTATTFAKYNDPDANPTSTLYCVIAANASNQPTSAQVPSTCDPDGTGTYVGGGWTCDRGICSKPCKVASSTAKCNTVKVVASKVVPFMFAPVIGYKQGNTGAVSSAACSGSCGTETPNPLDVVVMADRTASMRYDDRALMKTAILESLKSMNTDMHYVAFGTLHKSRTSGFTPKANTYGPQSDDYILSGGSCTYNCSNDDSSEYNYNGHWDGTNDLNGDGYCKTEASTKAPASTSTPISKWTFTTRRPNPGGGSQSDATSGEWVPVGFVNDYLKPKSQPTDPSILNNASAVVDGIACLPQSLAGEYGTNLASALKGAVKYAFANNPATTRPGTIRKVIIFETDGKPDEPLNFGDTSLSTGDVADTNGNDACTNFKSVADKAKAAYGSSLLIITIGFGDAATAVCSGTSKTVRSVLADAASPTPAGAASTANSCQGSDIDLENRDGDFFFCATSGSELGEIFKTAIASTQKGIRLVHIP